MESTSPLLGTGGDPAGFIQPCPSNGWKEAGEDTGAGTQQMHFVTQPRGVCVCWGKGWLGVWVHLLPLPANAGSLCTHGRQGPKGTAHGSLDFYPAVQTGRRQIRVSVGISSCQRHPQPLWVGGRASSLQCGLSHTHGHPNTASEFGRSTFHLSQNSVPIRASPLSKSLLVMLMPRAGLSPPHPLSGQDPTGWSPCGNDEVGCQRQARPSEGVGCLWRSQLPARGT